MVLERGSILRSMEGSPPLRLSRAQPGGHQLRREVVVHHQRERILAAAVALVAERGYRAVTVADIVKRAAIARAKFYENFASKQDCFLVACEGALEAALGRARNAAGSASGPHPDALAAGVEALLSYMSEQPQQTRACLVEAPLLGAALADLRERARAGFAALLREAGTPPGGAELPAGAEDAVLAGLYWILYEAVLSGEPADLRQLAPELLEFTRLTLLASGAVGSGSE